MKFKVGEIAVLKNCKHSIHAGSECLIIKYRGGERYDVDIPSSPIGLRWTTMPNQLRKKKKPEEKASWEEIQSITNWHPQKVTA